MRTEDGYIINKCLNGEKSVYRIRLGSIAYSLYSTSLSRSIGLTCSSREMSIPHSGSHIRGYTCLTPFIQSIINVRLDTQILVVILDDMEKAFANGSQTI